MNPPTIETLATGDEVVSGEVVDSNGAWISSALSEAGFPVARHSALPDDAAALACGIREIAARADLCVASGGLGPTDDDLTADVVSAVAGVPLDRDEEAIVRMKERTARAGIRFSEKNLRSARYPRGSMVMQNAVGTALAFALRVGNCQFFFLPGPPKEFRFFVDRHVIPWTEANLGPGKGAVLQFKTLGWAEAHLAEIFEDFPKLFPGVRVGYRAHVPETWIKLAALARSRDEALRALEPARQELERRIGPYVFATGREELPGVVHRELASRAIPFAVAESCTGGMVAESLTAHAGSSAYFLGGVVAYSNEVKERLLGVPKRELLESGAVSPAVALSMARGAMERLRARLAVAVTGIAGPGGGTIEKPVGLVYLALAWGDSAVEGSQVLERRFRGDRDRVRAAAALTALEMVRRQVCGADPLKDGPG